MNMEVITKIRGRQFCRSYSSFAKVSDVNHLVNSLPRVTGGGPFIDLPRFQPVGSSGAILNIQLPKSGLLNIRSTSIIALNGNVADLEAEIKPLSPGLWYQSVRLKSAASVLVSGNYSNYLLLNIKRDEKWFIKDADDVVAWSGFDLSITPSADDSISLNCQGEGTIVVQSTQKLFELNLEAGEQLLVSPNSLVGSNVPLSNLTGLSSDVGFRWFSQFFSSFGKIQSFSRISKYISQVYETILARFRLYEHADLKQFFNFPSLKRLMNFIKESFQARFLSGGALYYVVDGPAKLVVVDKSQVPKSLLFTKRQIIRGSATS